MVVDDEPSIVRTVCAILEVYGFKAVGAGSGQEAIAKVADLCPDVVLCDVMMPEMNGFETGLELKKLCPKCRLLFFTAYSNVSELSVDLTKAGHVFEVLSKPLPGAMLVNRIKAALAST